MPVRFLTEDQRARYGRFITDPDQSSWAGTSKREATAEARLQVGSAQKLSPPGKSVHRRPPRDNSGRARHSSLAP